MNDKMNTTKNEITTKYDLRYMISIVLIGVWIILIVFALSSIVFPNWLEPIANPGKKTEAKRYIETADMKFRCGQLETALNLYETALDIDPGNAPAMINLGVTYLKLKKTETGKQWLLKAEKIALPNCGTLFYHLGICFHNSGDIKKALKYYFDALDKEANNAMIFLQISRCYKEKNDISSQQKYLASSLQAFLDPLEEYKRMYWTAEPVYRESDPEIHEMIKQKLDSGFDSTDLNPFDLVTFQTMKRLDTFGGAIHFESGLASASENNYLEALDHFERAVQYDPNNKSARENIRKIRDALGKIK